MSDVDASPHVGSAIATPSARDGSDPDRIADDYREIVRLIRADHRITATKEIMSRWGLTLMESKRLMEAILESLHPSSEAR